MLTPSHPFQELSPAAQKRGLILFIGLVILINIAFRSLDGPLRTTAAPAGIISFEFAGDIPGVTAILNSWNSEARQYAALSLGLDFLYPILYGGAIALGCLRAAATWPAGSRAGGLGVILAWGVTVAGLLDYGENFALIQLLLGARDPIWPALAYWLAAAKFGLIFFGLLYLLWGGIHELSRRRRA